MSIFRFKKAEVSNFSILHNEYIIYAGYLVLGL